jgi:hypothetical protein
VTTYSAEINDDIAHAEGGHALIVFRGLQFIPQDLSLSVEAIDPALGLGALRPDGPVEARLTDKGLEIAVGPEIADRIAAGTAVCVALGNDIEAEALWPSLSPWMPPRRRQGRVNQPPARVVVAAKAPTQQGSRSAVLIEPKPIEVKRPAESAPPPGGKSPADGRGLPIAAGLAEIGKPAEAPEPVEAPKTAPPIVADAKTPAQPQTTKIELPPAAEKKRGVAAGIAALMTCAAFAAGAGLMFVMNSGIVKPTPGPDIKLSSPYPTLSALPKTSPRGKAVNLEEQQQFLARGLALRASDNEESEFWLKWAARSALGQSATSAALSALGVTIVRGHETPGNVATARLVWAMAALSGDCAAIRNLTTIHAGAEGKAIDASEAAEWRDQASRAGCPVDK